MIFSCLAYKPETKYSFYAVGNDKTLKEFENCVEKFTCHTGANFAQIVLMHGGRAIFAGVAEEDRPGSIQVLRPTFEKIFEV